MEDWEWRLGMGMGDGEGDFFIKNEKIKNFLKKIKNFFKGSFKKFLNFKLKK